jgi:hypothetical protein
MTRLILAWLALLSSFSAWSEDHQSGTLPDAPSAQYPTNQKQAVLFVVLLSRKSYCFPDLATSVTPLSSTQKFKLFVENSVSGHAVLGSAASAGFGQALNSPEEFGQGAEGYGKRFGASMARSATNNFFGTFLLASALRQDPRFFVRNSPTFRQALRYSLGRLIKTRTDSGVDSVNVSGLVGPLMGESLANVYLPSQERTVGKTLSRYATDMGWRAAGNLLREYWPAITQRLHWPRRNTGD